MGTPLYVWVERLKTVVGGETVYALRDGVKVPLSTDELIQELDRRHEGLLFPLRFTVSNRFLAETLSTVRAESLPSVESFQQWTLEEIEMAVRAQRKGPGPKPLKRFLVKQKIEIALRNGTHTRKWLEAASRDQIKSRFGCDHRTFEEALALIPREATPK